MDIACLDDLLTRLNFTRDDHIRKMLAVGLIAQSFERKSPDSKLSHQLAQILPIAERKQYEFYFDRIGRQVGYVIWNFVDGKLFVIDFSSESRAFLAVLKKMRDRTFFAFNEVHYRRTKNGKEIARKFSRSANSSFFHHSATTPNQSFSLSDNPVILHDAEPYLRLCQELAPYLLAWRHSRFYGNFSLAAAIYWISQLLSLRQVKLYYSLSGQPQGYLTWAWLSKRTISSVEKNPLHAIDLCEWNEGKTLCLIDVIASDEVFNEVKKDIVSELFSEQSEILLYYRKSSKDSVHVVEVDRYKNKEDIEKWMTHLQ